MKITWNDDAHQQAMYKMFMSTRKNKGDMQYASAFYILTADEELRRKCSRYMTSDGIDFLTMWEEEDFSSGHLHMTKLAKSLFAFDEVAMGNLIGTVDDDLFNVALNAILVRRHWDKHMFEDCFLG